MTRPFLVAFVLLSGCSLEVSDSGSGAGETGEVTSPLTFTVAPDPVTGIPIRTWSIPDANVHVGYFAQSFYLDDETFYFLSDHDNGTNLYLRGPELFVGISELAGKDVYDDVDQVGLTPALTDDWLFFADGRRIYRLPLGETTGIESIEMPDGEKLWAPIHATHDGDFLSMTVTRDAEPGVNYIARIEFATGHVDYLQSPMLGTEKPFVDHAQVHPTDPDRVMFAHTGSWVLDRVWLWHVDTGVTEPLWLHPDYTEAGHERWTDDGSRIYLVQYGQPAYHIPSALNFIESLHEVEQIGVNEEYYLGHAALSPDERYFASDTYRPDEEGRLWMVVYDIEAEEYHPVTEIRLESHPAHPHPSWAPSGSRFQFTDLDEDGRLVIREVLLADVLGT